MTVTGTSSPLGVYTCVIPSFLPINPSAIAAVVLSLCPPLRRSLQLDLHVDAGGQIELAKRVDRLPGRIENIEQPLVRADLALLARLLVDLPSAVHGQP